MLDEPALARFARHDRLTLQGDLPLVQAQLGLALVLIRPVAGIAVLRDNGPDVPVELDARVLLGGCPGTG